MLERRVIEVKGTVQGVGFRPFVHRLAVAGDLRGFVRNDAGRVIIDVEGDATGLDDFCTALTLRPPPLSTISSVHIHVAPPGAHKLFVIAPSATRDTPTTRVHGASSPTAAGDESVDAVPAFPHEAIDSAPAIPPDVATCDACLDELRDPSNRRHHHPFITCVDCGPRLTIVRESPYDRERTTMQPFARCDACETEYTDPLDRRFHAETISCHDCGPRLAAQRSPFGLTVRKGSALHLGEREFGAAALDTAVTVLRGGGIVAIKALGGYHLACDASDADAVARLRTRKRRWSKPLAVMVRDDAAVLELCDASADELNVLASPARPIVLINQRLGTQLAVNVAPENGRLGIMLPSTPVHHLLLAALDIPLVMTSGNRSGEPVAIDDAAAYEAFGDVADLLLTHDRDISARCDDSVVHVVAGDVRQIRRARGYVPNTVTMNTNARESILAVGGHLKNTVCVTSGRSAFLSPHVGDLDSLTTRTAALAAIEMMAKLADVQPSVLAHDLHPEYTSTRIAEWYADAHDVPHRVAVQHHHAHIAACVAEHGHKEPVIGVAFDGAGLGADGEIWGGEFLVVSGARFVRAGHVAYVPMIGGDAMARAPWRSAIAHMAAAGVDPELAIYHRPKSVETSDWELVRQLAGRPQATQRTSSIGRLFDAVASLAGFCHVAHHEGEAAMALEAAAANVVAQGYPVSIGEGTPFTFDASAIIHGVLSDLARDRDRVEIAAAFHTTLADLVVMACQRMREETGLDCVALSGGVFVNRRLTECASAALESRRFRVLLPRLAPCNDGGLALGQAYVAACALEEELCV